MGLIILKWPGHSITDGKLELDFKLEEARETEHILAMGKTVIFTDQKDLTLREIVETYDARNQIENDIAWLKDKLLIPLKPVYVRKDSQIRAHVFLCVTGLLLYNYLLYVIQDSSLSIKQLAEHLDQMRLGLVRDIDGKGKGRMKAAFVIEEMNKSTAEIFGKLQLGKYIPG
jgi:transposase